LRKIDCTGIILPFKDMFDVPAVLLQNAFNTMIPFADASRLCDFPPRLAAYQRLLL